MQADLTYSILVLAPQEREVPLGKAGGLKKVAVTRPIGSPPPDEAEDTSRLAVPQEVTDRMLRRILTFAGLPVAVSILFLPLFYFLKVCAKCLG